MKPCWRWLQVPGLSVTSSIALSRANGLAWMRCRRSVNSFPPVCIITLYQYDTWYGPVTPFLKPIHDSLCGRFIVGRARGLYPTVQKGCRPRSQHRKYWYTRVLFKAPNLVLWRMFVPVILPVLNPTVYKHANAPLLIYTRNRDVGKPGTFKWGSHRPRRWYF